MANPLFVVSVAKRSAPAIGCLGVVIVLFVVGAVMAIVLSGDDESQAPDANSGATCTPGDADASAVEIPEEYQDHVEAAAAESGLSTEIIAAQIYHESSWQEDVVSPANARGIAQFTEAAWSDYGPTDDWNDADNPELAIEAQGAYMAQMRERFETHADDEEHLTQLALAAYNAGEGMPPMTDYDVSEETIVEEHGSGHDYAVETAPYVENIMAAAEGTYASDCTHQAAGDVPEGDIVDASQHLAWEERVDLDHSTADDHGREEARSEYVEVADSIGDPHTAYYTDCGVFVASVMISSEVDPNYPPRDTRVQMDYLQDNDDYEFFTPDSTDDLEPGDILIANGDAMGHTYIYTGERHASEEDGHAQGASLYTRPPSGHYLMLTDNVGTYQVARHTGDDS